MFLTTAHPSWAAVPAVVAAAAAGARWLGQGGGNVYSDLGRRFYVPDPVLGGWKVVDSDALYLGLDVLGVLAGVAVGLAVAGWLLRRLERRRGRDLAILRLAAWGLGVATLAAPIAAFASGLGPDGGVATPPRDATLAAPTAIEPGAGVDAPAGRWTIAPHPKSVVVASIAAGGERFEGRFAAPTGEWQGDPRDLGAGATAKVSVPAKAIDTGIGPRSEHAVELLAAAAHPTIDLAITAVTGTRTDGDRIAFAARGTLTVMGKPIDLPITGTLRRADAAAARELGLPVALLVAADAVVDLRQTPLAGRAGDFDDPEVGVHVELVLVPAP